MKLKPILLIAVLVFATEVYAKKNCTDQPKDKWMTESDFKAMVTKQGYKISKFKQPGSCYEIYGQNAEGQKVEIYFNPVDGKIVKSEIED